MALNIAGGGVFGPVLGAGAPSSPRNVEIAELRTVRYCLFGFVFLGLFALPTIFIQEEDEYQPVRIQLGAVMFCCAVLLFIAALVKSRCCNLRRPKRGHVVPQDPRDVEPEVFDPRIMSLSPLNYIRKVFFLKPRRQVRSPPVRFDSNEGQDYVELEMDV